MNHHDAVANTREALLLLADLDPFDLVLSDVAMPGGSSCARSVPTKARRAVVISANPDWTDEAPTWSGLTLGKRVLVAEDDAAMRDLLTLVLRERGFEVDCVSTGSEMMSVLCAPEGSPTGSFDLIVTDVRMPGASGLDAVDQLRQGGDNTPVIAVTAFPHSATRQRARRLEVRLLAKPFDLNALREAVTSALDSRSAQRGSPS